MCEKFLDDRVNIPDKIKNMSKKEIDIKIANLEKRFLVKKIKKAV